MKKENKNKKKKSNVKGIIAGAIAAIMILGTLVPVILEAMMYS